MTAFRGESKKTTPAVVPSSSYRLPIFEESAMKIRELYELQSDFFLHGKTRPIKFRRKSLSLLLDAINRHQEEILDAMTADLGKARMEGYGTEVALVKQEIRYARAHLKSWMARRRVPTPIVHWPAKSFVSPEPKGVVLILSPWNYPFQLTLAPLVAALAAGNCAVVKPSRNSPRVTKTIQTLLDEIYSPEYVACVNMELNTYEEILAEDYGHIFFTGGEYSGIQVMKAAALHLTPVTLELGGKSPCLVDETADIPLAAKRIAWGKFLNAGQTCVAPDYLLVHERVAQPLVEEMKKNVVTFYGENPLENSDYPKIINHRHFQRLLDLLPTRNDPEKIAFGGYGDERTEKIEPTIITDAQFESRAMKEEIFGPILPVLVYQNLDDTIRDLQRRPLPLAFYLFTKNRETENKVLSHLRFGGGCVNDTVIHCASHHLPFGGVGGSGIGAYHGKTGFETFSHYRGIIKKATWCDLPFRYPPYTEKMFCLLRWIMR